MAERLEKDNVDFKSKFCPLNCLAGRMSMPGTLIWPYSNMSCRCVVIFLFCLLLQHLSVVMSWFIRVEGQKSVNEGNGNIVFLGKECVYTQTFLIPCSAATG